MNKDTENTRAMNIRGLDERFYNDFKQAVFKSGNRNVKEAIVKLMQAFIRKMDV